MENNNEQLNKLIDDRALQIVKNFWQSGHFTVKKIVDTPTDNLQAVNRKYVTNNGVVANRPKSSVATIGQPYFATDTNIPMTYSSGGWRNGVGSVVAQNN